VIDALLSKPLDSKKVAAINDKHKNGYFNAMPYYGYSEDKNNQNPQQLSNPHYSVACTLQQALIWQISARLPKWESSIRNWCEIVPILTKVLEWTNWELALSTKECEALKQEEEEEEEQRIAKTLNEKNSNDLTKDV